MTWQPTRKLRLKPEWLDNTETFDEDTRPIPVLVPVQRKWVRTWVEVEWRDEP